MDQGSRARSCIAIEPQKGPAEQINNLSDADWQRMKEHMDAKFPNMAMPNMDTFKEMVKLFGMSMELDEKKLN